MAPADKENYQLPMKRTWLVLDLLESDRVEKLPSALTGRKRVKYSGPLENSSLSLDAEVEIPLKRGYDVNTYCLRGLKQD